MECVDREKTLYLNSGCEIIDTEADSNQQYSVFKQFPVPPGRFIYKALGSVIIPGTTFTKIWLDKTLSTAIKPSAEEPETKKEEKVSQKEEKVSTQTEEKAPAPKEEKASAQKEEKAPERKEEKPAEAKSEVKSDK